MARIFKLTDSGLKADEEESLVRILGQEQVLIFPTETYYGLGGLGRFPSVYQKIFELKGRSASKQLPFCAADADMVLEFMDRPPAAFFSLARAFWPGPLTLVLPAKKGLFPEMFPGQVQTMAVRVPSPDWLRQLIKKAGALLISTSANLSGQPPLASFDEVYRLFSGRVEFFIDGSETPGEQPSTIIDLTGPEPVGRREGKIPFSEIWSILFEA